MDKFDRILVRRVHSNWHWSTKPRRSNDRPYVDNPQLYGRYKWNDVDDAMVEPGKSHRHESLPTREKLVLDWVKHSYGSAVRQCLWPDYSSYKYPLKN